MDAPREDRRARFLVLDGVDGCGKTTQAGLLVRALGDEGCRDALHLREPGSTAAGERIRELLLDPSVELGAASEALLFVAARRQMLDEVVRPALAGGRDVVCERFHASTFAYQAVAGGLDEEGMLALFARWAGDPIPDLTVILDLDVEVAVGRRGTRDRFEARGIEFQRKVAAGYRRYAEVVEHAVLVPAAGEPEEVARRVLEEVSRAGR